jgi:hypothetical protein
LGTARQQLLGDFVPNIDNTLLIEERASKCRLQPLNFIAIPDYSEVEHDMAVIAAHGGSEERGLQSDSEEAKQQSVQDKRMEDRAILFGKIFGCEASTFYERHSSTGTASNQPGDEPLMKLDAYLVALIGILSELRDVASIPVWIAAGGLTPNVEHTFTDDMAKDGWSNVVQIDSGLIDVPLTQLESNLTLFLPMSRMLIRAEGNGSSLHFMCSTGCAEASLPWTRDGSKRTMGLIGRE